MDLEPDLGGTARVHLKDLLQVLVTGGALGVPLGAELGPLELTDEGGQLVRSMRLVGVDLGQVIEQLGNPALINGQRLLGLGHDLANEHLATVGDVGDGDGIEKGVEVDRLALHSRTLATTPGQVGEDQTLLDNGQGGQGTNAKGDLGTGVGQSGTANGQGDGVKGHGQGGDEGKGNNGSRTHLGDTCWIAKAGPVSNRDEI